MVHVVILPIGIFQDLRTCTYRNDDVCQAPIYTLLMLQLLINARSHSAH